ncbi:M20 metallopeptidase family protein [Acidaminobacter hydrogenoformans]|uniref:Amidohydrolase n=1 Tax=Acidaminobacter hydrogenoformans DSM 2784 TaxID=1120920 RepID=A0A1G5S3G1_9FIRM|nr:M20 family metallopeptidase [Acidaminobacter hydrogenoformans]SCZ80291.1 amidohydrolase [Acidaminobacter hydrogenoformans DSM 2784]
MTLLHEALNIKDDIITWRRALHKIPETGLHLPKTAAYIAAQLEAMGIPYKTFDSHSGILAWIGDPGSPIHPVKGKTIALRADMDALNINEETGAPFKSENDKMHACGHDAHVATLLGAAKLLKSREASLNGCIKLIFQPAEEGPGGAVPMIQDGVLENPKVDAMFAMHVFNVEDTTIPGAIGVRQGAMFASDDQIYLKIKGKGGHGSAPHETVDPVTIAAHIIVALQSIISREVNPASPAVITIASLSAGRGTNNIIPDCAEMLGTIRTLSFDTRAFVLKRIEEIIDALIKGFRADYELSFYDSYPPVINDEAVTTRFLKSARKILPEDEIVIMKDSLMGGEDAAFFFEQVPGTYFLLNTSMLQDGQLYPIHNARFMLDDAVLYKGAAVFVQAALDALESPDPLET